jgi:hypothetical protein
MNNIYTPCSARSPELSARRGCGPFPSSTNRCFAVGIFLLLTVSLLSTCSKPKNNGAAVAQPQPSGTAIPQTTPQSTPDDALKIGIIKKPFLIGCGCYFHFPDDHNKEGEWDIFQAEIDDNAQMNIDGEDVMLKFVSRTDLEEETKVGSTRSELYKSDDTEVVVEYVVKELCDPEDTECESIQYSATITVTRKGVSRKVSALGVCGC